MMPFREDVQYDHCEPVGPAVQSTLTKASTVAFAL
jgi:hypothetical protein